MMKFILMIMFMNFMVMLNNMVMFYYNLCFMSSFFLIFMFMNKDVEWFNMMLMWGCNYYSIILMVLSMWIMSLMFMCLNYSEGKVKLLIFINMLIVMMMFFMFTDLILFYLVFEISLIPTFFLIIYWGGNVERVSASYYMMMYMLLISFPLLVYIFDMYMYSFTLKFMLLMKVMENYEVTFWKFLMIYMAFFIKMPVYVFHIWLPKAHVEAPVYGSMILAGVLLKMGSYGLIRLMEVFYSFTVKYSYLVISVGIVGSVVVSLVCLIQIDMKSMVAYSSVVHMNLMLCSLMTLSKVGVLGGYLMMIAHGLCSSGMFYMVNMYYSRTGSRMLFMNKGMLNNFPSLVMWWFLFCIVNFSFPMSLNFIGEALMLMVILNWDKGLLMYLIMISFFSGAYSLYLFSYISHGKNMFYESSFYDYVTLKEYMVLILHFFPLLGLLFNLVFFM